MRMYTHDFLVSTLKVEFVGKVGKEKSSFDLQMTGERERLINRAGSHFWQNLTNQKKGEPHPCISPGLRAPETNGQLFLNTDYNIKALRVATNIKSGI